MYLPSNTSPSQSSPARSQMTLLMLILLLANLVFADPTLLPSALPTSSSPSVSPTTALPSTSPTTSPTTFSPTTVPPSSSPTTVSPSSSPTTSPSSSFPSIPPTVSLSHLPSELPTSMPSFPTPTELPSLAPSFAPTESPNSSNPTSTPTQSLPTTSPAFSLPSVAPSKTPSTSSPTQTPSHSPTVLPSQAPTQSPSHLPTVLPSQIPSSHPSSSMPTIAPSVSPTSSKPSYTPTFHPTWSPTASPSFSPSSSLPTKVPLFSPPTFSPSWVPTTSHPSTSPSQLPSHVPTVLPSFSPTSLPTSSPSNLPTRLPTMSPTHLPTLLPSFIPTNLPTSKLPTTLPTFQPTNLPTSKSPTTLPTFQPTKLPSNLPTRLPTQMPSTARPSTEPTTSQPSAVPTSSPSFICPAGTSNPGGIGTNFACTKCPKGMYDDPSSLGRTECVSNMNVCDPTYWCGAGAVMGESYVQVLNFTKDISGTLVVGSRRDFIFDIVNLAAEPLILTPIAFPKGVTSKHAPVLDAFFFQLPIEVDANEIGTSSEETKFRVTLRMQGKYVKDTEDATFFVEVSLSLTLVSVVVNPSSFAFSLKLGQTLPNLGLMEILNPLCSDYLIYRAYPCEGSLVQIAPSQQLGNIPSNQGVGNRLSFSVDLSLVQPLTNFSLDAIKIATCIQFDMALLPMNVTFPKEVPIELTVLQDCPPGWVSTTGTNEKGCSFCNPGTFQEDAGKTVCLEAGPGFQVVESRDRSVMCERGYFASSEMVSCSPCPQGFYADNPASSECKPCTPSLPWTLQVGATALENCTTGIGQNQYLVSQGNPQPCPASAICYDAGITVETLKLRAGYFRTGPTSLDIRACKPQFCVPQAETNNSTPRRRLGDDVLRSEYCSPNHKGHLCEICEEGYVHRGENRTCQVCMGDSSSEDSGRMVGIFFLFTLVLLFVCWFVVYRFYERYRPKLRNENAEEEIIPFWSRKHLVKVLDRMLKLVDFGGTPFKIVIGYYQVVAGMALGLSEYLPSYFKQFAEIFSLLSLDFVKVFDFGCSLPEQSHRSSLLFATLLPMGFLIGLKLVERFLIKRKPVFVESKLDREALGVGFMNLYLWTLFLVYPSVSKTIFQTFSRSTFDDGASYIRIDHQIECSSALYSQLFYYALVCVVVYVMGVPLLFFVVLDKQRYELNACPEFEMRVSLAYREKNIKVQGTRILWHSYRPPQYNFEVFELVRKLFQTSVFVFISADTAAQVIFLLVTCSISIVILGWLSPYVQMEHNALAQWSQWNIFAIAFVALLNRMELTTLWEKDMLGVLLLICLVSVPVLAFLSGVNDYTKNRIPRTLSRWYHQVLHFFKRTRHHHRDRTHFINTSHKSIRKNDFAVNSAVEELRRHLQEIAVDEKQRDPMLLLLDSLDKKYQEEAEVSRVERSILRNDATEKGLLKKKIVELIEKVDELQFGNEVLQAEKEHFEREWEIARKHTEDGPTMNSTRRRATAHSRGSFVDGMKRRMTSTFGFSSSAPTSHLVVDSNPVFINMLQADLRNKKKAEEDNDDV